MRSLKTLKSRYTKKEIAAILILFSADVFLLLTIWLERKYDHISFDQIFFHLKSTLTGVQSSLMGSAVLNVGVFSVILTALQTRFYRLLSERRGSKPVNAGSQPRRAGAGFSAYLKKHALSLSSIALIAALFLCGAQTDIYAFVRNAVSESEFIPEHYADPDEVKLTFPEKKRNLIYIFLESMESSYADPLAGGEITSCFIPELQALAEDNINFSHTAGLGGALSYPGTTWTAAAMAAQTSGVVVKMSLDADAYGGGDYFLPGATSIGDILKEQGYNQVLLLGSNAEFHGREIYFTEHGHYQILDTDSLKASGRLAEDYEKWWGFEDQMLFSYAREELTRLAEEGKPFNFTMLTADTHFPDGCACPLCRDDYESPYANVLACSSRQVAGFIEWIREQPFYEDTTIVISGDHLTMDAGFMDDVDPEYTRTVYNCFINPAVRPEKEKNRLFGTFDMFPTTLAAMGVKIDGDRLALGTNLFSGRQTLTECFGYEYLSEELQKQSDFYDSELLEPGKESD